MEMEGIGDIVRSLQMMAVCVNRAGQAMGWFVMTFVATWRALLVPYAARKIPVVGAALMVIAALSDFPELEMVAPANKLGQMMVQLARTFVAPQI